MSIAHRSDGAIRRAISDDPMIIEVLRRTRHAILFDVFRRGIEIGRHSGELALNEIGFIRRPQPDRAFRFQLQQVIMLAVI